MRTRRLAALLAAAAPRSPLGACGSVSEAVARPRAGARWAIPPRSIAARPARCCVRARAAPAAGHAPIRCGAPARATFFNDQRASQRRRHPDRADQHRRQRQDLATRPPPAATSDQHRRHPATCSAWSRRLGKILPRRLRPGQRDQHQLQPRQRRHRRRSTAPEQITLTIAAVVTQVLPNGNLVIQGTPGGARPTTRCAQLTVAGIVRPEDISSANTILHTQIAEARINYGGRGDIRRCRRPPAARPCCSGSRRSELSASVCNGPTGCHSAIT